MASLSFLGNSFLLACCGSFWPPPGKYNTTELKNFGNSTLKSGNEFEISNFGILKDQLERQNYSQPNISSSHFPKKLPIPGIQTVSGSHINFNINFPFSENSESVKENLVVDSANKSISNGNNILQINIFNNGAPVSRPVITSKESYGALAQNSPDSETEDDKSVKLPWWKTSVVYQIYPRSFKDSDASGTGDLNGITSKADYLESLGIGAVWISPIYASPMADFGYDISDFTKIDPIFGSDSDFDELLTEMHRRGIKVILDFVPNHSSSEHEWFKKSVKKIHPYTDYYVWKKSRENINGSGSPSKTNNWLSVFGGSAWEWNEERQEFYLHQFLKEQPDLNVRNPAVLRELDNILRFWLDKGVDGFRIDALKFLYETRDMSHDEPINEVSGVEDPSEYSYLNHTLTVNQPETVEVIRRWRKISDEYTDRLIVVEVYDNDIQQVVKYYGNDNSSDQLAHFPFNFYFITDLCSRSDVTGEKLKYLIEKWLANMPEGEWPNWVLGNHDRGRIASRLGNDLVDALNMVSLLLPGTPTTYYGEEIGMEDTTISFEEAKDPFGLKFGPERYKEFGRDPSRTPMQWGSTPNADFSTANSTWLPTNENYKDINVNSQRNDSESSLKVFMKLARIRLEKTFLLGSISYSITNKEIFSFIRSYEGEPSYMIMINTSKSSVNLGNLNASEILPTDGQIVLRSSTDFRPETAIGTRLILNEIILMGGEGMVIKLTQI